MAQDWISPQNKVDFLDLRVFFFPLSALFYRGFSVGPYPPNASGFQQPEANRYSQGKKHRPVDMFSRAA